MKILNAILFFTVVSFLSSCGSDKSKDLTNNEITSDSNEVVNGSSSVKLEYDSLYQRVEFYWDTLVKIDEEKFSSLVRLYDEMEIMPESNSFKVAKLRKKLEKVEELVLDQKDLSVDKIDEFDNATSELISKTKDLFIETPNGENYKVAVDMINEVSRLDGYVVAMKRQDYCDAVDAYNAFIDNNKTDLEDLKLNTAKLIHFIGESELGNQILEEVQ